MRKLFLALGFVSLLQSVWAQDSAPATTDTATSKPSEFYLGIQKTTIDSATVKNALASQNGLLINRVLQSTFSHSMPMTSELNGTSFEIGWNKRHGSGFYKSIFTFGGGSFSNTSTNLLEYDRISVPMTSGTTTQIITADAFAIQLLNSTKLNTARMSYTGVFYFLNENPNPLLKNLGVNLGAEILGNQTIMTGVIGSGGFSQREIKHGEGFGNIILGLSYYFDFLQKNRIEFGISKVESLVSVDGSFLDKQLQLVSFGTLTLPAEAEFKGKQRTSYSGQRFNLGYRYSVNDSFAIRLNFSRMDATHTIEDSKVKGQPNLFALLFTPGGLSGAIVPFVASAIPALGPYPENKDIRSFISLEFIYMF